MISPTLLRKELRQLRWKLLIGLALLSVVGVGYPFVHRSLVKLFQNALSDVHLPFGFSQESLLGMSNYTVAIYSNWNTKNLVQLGTLFAILFGMSLFANEYEANTISFLLGTSLSRKSIFWTKVAAGLIALTCLVLIPTVAILPASALSGLQFEHLRWLWGVIVTFSGLTFFYAISVWWSARVTDGLKAGLYSLVIAVLLLLLGVIPGLAALSPFRLMAAYPYFRGTASFPWLTVLLFLGLTAVVLLSAYQHFRKRDV